MSINDCNGCRSPDCDTCVARRQHAKHEHCIDCQRCLIGEGDADIRVFGRHVGDQSENDGDRCTRCVPCVQECSCDSEYEHMLAVDESRRDFLRSPGPPPAHFTDEEVARAEAGIARDRAALTKAGRP